MVSTVVSLMDPNIRTAHKLILQVKKFMYMCVYIYICIIIYKMDGCISGSIYM